MLVNLVALHIGKSEIDETSVLLVLLATVFQLRRNGHHLVDNLEDNLEHHLGDNLEDNLEHHLGDNLGHLLRDSLGHHLVVPEARCMLKSCKEKPSWLSNARILALKINAT